MSAGKDIACRIRAELVCCDIFDRAAEFRRDPVYFGESWELARQLDEFIGHHEICYWGEAAALIAEDYDA